MASEKTPAQRKLAQQVKQRYPDWAKRLRCLGRGTCRAETMDINTSGIVFRHGDEAVVVCDNGNVSAQYPLSKFTLNA